MGYIIETEPARPGPKRLGIRAFFLFEVESLDFHGFANRGALEVYSIPDVANRPSHSSIRMQIIKIQKPARVVLHHVPDSAGRWRARWRWEKEGGVDRFTKRPEASLIDRLMAVRCRLENYHDESRAEKTEDHCCMYKQ